MSMILAGTSLAALTVLAAVLLIRRFPLACLGWLSRRALRRSGVRPHWIDTSIGRVSLWTGGSGAPLVLLHGAGDQAGTWARTVPALVGRYRLLVLDLPGHGGSDPRSGPLSVGTILAGVSGVLEALTPDAPAILVGNSLGAWIALLYARTHPSRVARVVLVNGGALRHEHTGVTLTPATRAEARLTLEALLGAQARRTPDFVLDDLIRLARVGPLGRLSATSDEMDQYLLDGRLQEVSAPVDLLWGDRDGVFPLEYARRMEAGLPAVRLTVLPGCGHTPQRNSPGRFRTALLSLLAQPAPEATHAAR